MSATTRNLYSLNDRDLLVELGQLGMYTIAKRPEGAPWGVTVIADRNVRKDKGDDDMPIEVCPATVIVEDIVNRYPGEGLFIAAVDDKPSPEEVIRADSEFALSDRVLIEQANLVWDATKNRNKIDVRARHAARRRSQKVEWAIDTIVELMPCPFCAEPVRKSASKCRHCSEWLDESKRPGAEVPRAAIAGKR